LRCILANNSITQEVRICEFRIEGGIDMNDLIEIGRMCSSEGIVERIVRRWSRHGYGSMEIDMG
jgi:hypothetical protein